MTLLAIALQAVQTIALILIIARSKKETKQCQSS